MINKLLNKKNLIITVMIVVFILLFMPHGVYGAEETVTVSEYLKSAVAGMYSLISAVCALILWIILIGGFINSFLTQTANAKYMLRRILFYIGISILALVFLTYFYILLININEGIIEQCREWAYKMSGVDATLENAGEYDEVTLFESAISKAYELKATSGFAGMFMYIILVYYTVRFTIIYAKRYLIVLILIVVGPILILQNAVLRTFSGKSGKIVLWLKELIFNIYIQVFHAFAYSALVGLTIRFSDSVLSFVGVILTLIVFASMTVIEHTIRTIFNFVGGSSSVKSTASSLGSLATDFISDPKGTAASVGESVKGIPDSLKGKAVTFKNNAVNNAIGLKNNSGKYLNEIKGSIKGNNITVTEKEVEKEKERMENPKALDKVEDAIRGVGKGAVAVGKKTAETGKDIKNKTVNFGKTVKNKAIDIKDLSIDELKLARKAILNQKNNFEQTGQKVVNRISKTREDFEERQEIRRRIRKKTATQEEIEFISQYDDEHSLRAEIQKMKKAIKSSDDLVVAYYKLKGPSPFIMQAKFGGMPSVGMTAIRTSLDLEKLLNGDIAGSGVKDYKRTILIPSPNNIPIKQVDLQIEDQGESKYLHRKRKKYTFKEFSPGAVKTITGQLMFQTLMRDGSAFSLLKVRQMLKSDEGVTPVGRPKAPKNVDEENVTEDIKPQTIHYTSKTSKQFLMALQVRRDYNFGIYRERANDNKWARYISANNQVKRTIKKNSKIFGVSQNVVTQDGQSQYEQRFGLAQINAKEERQQRITTGIIVATAMQYNRALETVDLKNDEKFRKSLLSNLNQSRNYS